MDRQYLDNDPNVLLRRVYDALYEVLDGPSIAAAVLIVAKYQYQSAFVADQEINLLAAMTEIMVECEYKWLTRMDGGREILCLLYTSPSPRD